MIETLIPQLGPNSSHARADRRLDGRAVPGEQVIRIMHLASGDLWAGAEVQLFNLVLALREHAGVEIRIVLLNHGLLAQRFSEAGVEVVVLDEQAYGSASLLWKLIGLVRKWQPHILHSHRYKENTLGSLAASCCRPTKSVRTVHGAAEFRARFYDLQKSLPQWLDRVCARWLQRKVICVSKDLTNTYAGYISPDRLAVVANGVDFRRLERDAAALITLPGQPSRLKICFMGRMEEVKRVDLVLEIARLLEKRQPGRYGFYLFGDGRLMRAHTEAARQYGLENSVHFMGFVPTTAPYLRQMDLLLITSDHEGLPMSVLEAMYLQVHILSHAVGAIPETLGGGKYGTLLWSQRPGDYVDAIERLSVDPQAASSNKQAAREHVVTRYSADQTAREYLDIYNQLRLA